MYLALDYRHGVAADSRVKEGERSMQEEVTQKSIAITFRASRLTADVLMKAFKAYLAHRKHREPSHGKISVKKLLAQNQGAKSIEITDENIRPFIRIAGKYNVDFSVKRDRTAVPPKYLVFFKAKDADLIVQAFKEFVRANEKKKQRVSLRAKIKRMKQDMAKDQNRERTREKQADRGQSL